MASGVWGPQRVQLGLGDWWAGVSRDKLRATQLSALGTVRQEGGGVVSPVDELEVVQEAMGRMW